MNDNLSFKLPRLVWAIISFTLLNVADVKDVPCNDWDWDILSWEKGDEEGVAFEHQDDEDGEDLIGAKWDDDNGTWIGFKGKEPDLPLWDGEDVTFDVLEANVTFGILDGEDVTLEILDGVNASCINGEGMENWDGETVIFENLDGDGVVLEVLDGEGEFFENWDGEEDVTCENPCGEDGTWAGWCVEEMGWKELETCDPAEGIEDFPGWITDRGEMLLIEWFVTSGVVLSYRGDFPCWVDMAVGFE